MQEYIPFIIILTFPVVLVTMLYLIRKNKRLMLGWKTGSTVLIISANIMADKSSDQAYN